MTTQEVANRLVELCRQGQNDTAVKELYSQDIVSIEPKGAPAPEIHGLEGVIQKGVQFGEMLEEMHSMEISDPLVADNFFSVTMNMDVTFKGAPRSKMEELCVYHVKDGKINREEFFFTPMMPPQ